MTDDIVARLRTWSADESTWGLLTEAAAEIARLRAALQTIADYGETRIVSVVYRDDGVQSKNDKCPHDKRMWEDCAACTADYARRAALAGEKTDA